MATFFDKRIKKPIDDLLKSGGIDIHRLIDIVQLLRLNSLSFP